MPERFEGRCLNPNTGLENPMLMMSSFRAETHVAQQSRRDKLRVHQGTPTSSNHPIQDFQTSMLNSVADPDHHPRSIRNYDIVYDPSTAIFSSEMFNFSSSAAAAATNEPSGGGGPSSSIEDNHHLATHSSSVPASYSYWNKGPSPSQTPGGDWNPVSYGSGNQGGQLFVGGVKEGNISSSSPSYKTPPYSHLHDLSTQEGNSQKQHYGELHYNPTAFYPNALPDVVPSSSSSSGFEVAGQGSWVDAGNELLSLPRFQS